LPRRAVFLDRDGVLIRDVHLLTRTDQVEFLPGAPAAVGRLNRAGLLTVVVTNQTVVARGLATEEDVARVHAWMQARLREEGGAIDRFYLCPHHPQATVPRYRVECTCRKPRPGMLLQAAAELGIDLGQSYLVGDRVSDVAAGRHAGVTTILVETGMHDAPPITSVSAADAALRPHHTFPDLAAAVDWLRVAAGAGATERGADR
jgi:D-glycero-D-manno-heptose 1,7-bisphosphate phosphatase